MCDPVTAMMVAGTAMSVGGTIIQGQQQQDLANSQAAQASLEGAYRMDAAKVQAANIRKAGIKAKGTAKVTLAASGVKLGEGTALEVQKDITEMSEKDALTAILNGERAQSSAEYEAELLRAKGENAKTNSYFEAGSNVLAAGASYKKGGWKT